MQSQPVSGGYELPSLVTPSFENDLALYATNALPVLSVNESDIDFGYLTYGQLVTNTFILSNVGFSVLTISNILISGSSFSIGSYQGTISAQTTSALDVVFDPAHEGVHDGVLTITHDGGDEKNINITGVSYSSPFVSIPSPVDFNDIAVGAAVTNTVLLSNRTPNSISINGYTSPTGDFSSSFAFSNVVYHEFEFNGAVEGFYANGAGSPVLTTMSPGTPRSGTVDNTVLQIKSSAAGWNFIRKDDITFNASVTKIKVWYKGLTGNSNTEFRARFDFGTSNVVVTAPVNINVNAWTEWIIDLPLAGVNNMSAVTEFRVQWNGASNDNVKIDTITMYHENSSELIAGNSVTSFDVVFSPSSAGVKSSEQIFSNSVNENYTLVLQGYGITGSEPILEVDMSDIDFGLVPPGTSGTNTLLLSNSGSAVLNLTNLSFSSGEFTVSTYPATVSVGASVSVELIYSPSAEGGDEAVLTITHDGGTVKNITAKGLGYNSSIIMMPDTYDFGAVSAGAAATNSFILSNVTGTSVSITNISSIDLNFSHTYTIPPTVHHDYDFDADTEGFTTAGNNPVLTRITSDSRPGSDDSSCLQIQGNGTWNHVEVITAGSINSLSENLSLWFKGDAGNTNDFYKMRLRTNGVDKYYSILRLTNHFWDEWVFDFAAAGIDPSDVTDIRIYWKGSASDIVYVDDIEIYSSGSTDVFTAHESLSFDVIFSPTNNGLKPADLTFSVDGYNDVVLSLQGTGGSGDVTAPIPVISISEGTGPTNVTLIHASVNFGELVTGFAVGDIVVSSGTKQSFVNVDDTNYTFEISNPDHGTLTIDISSNVCVDGGANANEAAVQKSILLDYSNALPVITITEGAGPTNVSVLHVSINFNEPVIGFVLGDAAVSNGSPGSWVNTGNTNYVFEISSIADGQVAVDVAAGAAKDAAGNLTLAAVQKTAFVDTISPVPVITIAQGAGPTNSDPVNVTVSFGETVTGFTNTDPVVSNGTIQNFLDLGSGNFSFEIANPSEGTLTVDIPAAAAADLAENSSTAAVQKTVFIDITSPVPVISNAEGSPTSADPIHVTVDFGEAVSGFVSNDIILSSGVMSNFTNYGSGLYEVEVWGLSDAVHTIDVNSGTAVDTAGNTNYAAAQYSVTINSLASTPVISAAETGPTNAIVFSMTVDFGEVVGGFSDTGIVISSGTIIDFTDVNSRIYTFSITNADEGTLTVNIPANVATNTAAVSNTSAAQFSIVYDSTVPVPVIDIAEGNGPTNADPINVSISFEEPVNGFVSTNVTVSNGVINGWSNTGGSNYAFEVTGSSDGTITVNVNAGIAYDYAGNANSAAVQADVVVDRTAPLPFISNAEGITTGANPINVTVDFGETVAGFIVSDLTISHGDISNFTDNSNGLYSLEIWGMSNGLHTIDVSAGTAVDTAGNQNLAAVQYTVTINTNIPVPVIVIAEGGGPTNISVASVSVVFSEAVTGFTSSDVIVSSGVIGNWVGTGNSNFTFELSGMSEGSVTVDVPAGAASNALLFGNKAALQQTIVIDNTAPAVSVISGPSGSVTTNEAFSVTLSVTERNGYWSTNGTDYISFTNTEIISVEINAAGLWYYGDDGYGNVSSTTANEYTWKVLSDPDSMLSFDPRHFFVNDGVKVLTINLNFPEAYNKVSIEIFDAKGSLLRKLSGDDIDLPNFNARWDGTDEYGNQVNGIVYVKIFVDGLMLEPVISKIVVLKGE
jgi:hypothetical protein